MAVQASGRVPGVRTTAGVVPSLVHRAPALQPAQSRTGEAGRASAKGVQNAGCQVSPEAEVSNSNSWMPSLARDRRR